MGKNKLFSELDQAKKEMQHAAGSKAHPVVSEEEKAQRKAEGRTRGAKGAKMDRINMAFRPEIFEYIEVMSRVTGMSKTGFVNFALTQHMEEHGDLYDKAKDFRRSL